jgi:dephospho-CoA kinase
VDADKLGHLCYDQNIKNCVDEIEKKFGPDSVYITEEGKKNVNRKVLGPIVFSDKSKLDWLSNLVWPLIQELIQQEMTQSEKEGYKYFIIESATLIESGLYKIFDQVWCFSVSKEEAVKRLMNRNNLTEQESLNRINSQMTNEEREKFSTIVIHTDGEMDEIKEKIKNLLN